MPAAAGVVIWSDHPCRARGPFLLIWIDPDSDAFWRLMAPFLPLLADDLPLLAFYALDPSHSQDPSGSEHGDEGAWSYRATRPRALRGYESRHPDVERPGAP